MHPQVKSVVVAGCLLVASTLGAMAFEAVTVEPSELREGASLEFAPIAELPEGSIVEVLNCDRDWCEVSVEDYDGFLPRDVLDLGGTPVPLYTFPPQVAAPGLWHGRYFSRDHFRYESRSRWRNREGRRLFVVPIRPQPRPLRPIGPNEWRGKRQFDQKGPAFDQRGKKQFEQKGPAFDQRGKKQFEQKGPTPDQRRIQRGPEQPRIQRTPDQPRPVMKQEPRPQIQRQAPVQRQAPAPVQKQATPPPTQPQKKKQDPPR